MKKNLLKSQKGVTLLSLVITIVVILILTSTVIFQVNDTTESNRLNDLYADINLLEDKILLYYNNYSEIPVVENQSEIILGDKEIQREETDKFYEIDLTKLRGITLKYGNKTDREDIYIVNNRTLKVYYLKGIEVGEQKYYCIDNTNEIGDTDQYSKLEIKTIAGEKNSEGVYITEVSIVIEKDNLLGTNQTTCLCEFTDEEGNTKQILNESVNENKIIKLDKNGTYRFILTALDKNGNKTTTEKTIKINIQNKTTVLADVITHENYGDTIEYEANGVKDWKIFFNDGNNVFIITSKFIPDTSMPKNSKMISDNTYKITWKPIYGAPTPGFEGHAPIVTDITENSKILERAKKFKFTWMQENIDKNLNKAAAAKDLLNNDVWNEFEKGLQGVEAIGAPTLEMFAESWEQKGYKKIKYSYNNEEGYSIGDNGEWLSLADGNGYQDSLYFPYQLNSNQEDQKWAETFHCVAYWLTAVSSKDNHGLLCIDGYGGIFPDWYSAFYIGLRPVVCLPSNAVAVMENGVWTNLTVD